jgi:hypothetical protein
MGDKPKRRVLYIPHDYVCADGYKLGQVLSCVRTGQYALTEAQRQILVTLGVPVHKLRCTLDRASALDLFEQAGYTCDLTNYKNNASVVLCACAKNHPAYTTSVRNFKAGHRCRVCVGKAKPTVEDAIALLHSLDYEAPDIQREYKHSRSILKLLCTNGHEWQTTVARLKEGYGRCYRCGGHRTRTTNEAVVEFQKCGFTVLHPEEYKNSKTCVQLVCAIGHTFQANLNNVKNGHGCPECYRTSGRTDPNQIADMFKKLGFIINLDTYTSKRDWVDLTCTDCGHKFRRNGNSFLRNKHNDCPACHKNKAK